MIQMTEIQYYFCVFMIAFWSFCIVFITGEANEKVKKNSYESRIYNRQRAERYAYILV